MSLFFLISANYQYVQIGLFDQTTLVDHVSEDKSRSSATIIPHIDALLHKNNYTLDDLAFIAANQGPGPFTTLRVTIATVNGISFASGKPLIGINSLEGLIRENENAQWPYTVALLNAFSNEVYYTIQSPEYCVENKCGPITTTLETIKKKFPQQTIRFIGNGAQLFRDTIIDTFGNYAFIPDPLAAECSLEFLGTMAWHN